MTETDISTAVVERLLDGVTPGPWHVEDDWNVHCGSYSVMHGSMNIVSDAESEANANFTAASRDLVPTLLAERDALKRENENLRQIERNVQAVREHEYKRAEAALADVERLKAQPVTLQDAAKTILALFVGGAIDPFDSTDLAVEALAIKHAGNRRDGVGQLEIAEEFFVAALTAIAEGQA